MTGLEYIEGNQPWVRQNAQQLICPYCGKKELLVSYGDVKKDDLRVELYCDNTYCDVREFTIVALRTNGRVQRADVIALEEIDAGTDSERLPDVISIMSREGSDLIDAHTRGLIDRRRRDVKVEITPIAPTSL